ncbi:22459_t:CDS:1, partial [Gigaspora rosea]
WKYMEESSFQDFYIPILLRGIAFHHFGLLPLLEEMVELIFQGLICY